MSELRSELWEKEMKLTDIRLEALNSAHQLEQLRETMHNMQVRAAAPRGLRSSRPRSRAAAPGWRWDAAGTQLLTLGHHTVRFSPSWRWIS